MRDKYKLRSNLGGVFYFRHTEHTKKKSALICVFCEQIFDEPNCIATVNLCLRRTLVGSVILITTFNESLMIN